jgi:hypothetical protein
VQKSKADLFNTQATIELLENEIRAPGGESDNIDGQFAQLNKEFTVFKQQLVTAEEEKASLRSRIEFNARLKLQMKAVIHRTNQQQWILQKGTIAACE